MDVYARLKELNITLPEPPPPGAGVNKPVVQVGNLLFVSGKGPVKDGKPVFTGKVGKDLTVEQGAEGAKIVALNILSILQRHLGGDLNKIKRIVKTLGFVQSPADFHGQPQVINGCSNVFKDIWGEENGVGARSAIGVNELPNNFCCEIEFIFEIK